MPLMPNPKSAPSKRSALYVAGEPGRPAGDEAPSLGSCTAATDLAGLLRCWAAENIAPTATTAAAAARTVPCSATLTHKLASDEAWVAISSASKALTDVLISSMSAASSAASAASPPRSHGLARAVTIEARNGSALGAALRRPGTHRMAGRGILPCDEQRWMTCVCDEIPRAPPRAAPARSTG